MTPAHSKKASKTPPKPVGRPCKYCTNQEEVNKSVEEYLLRCQENEKQKQIMPFLEELCLTLDIDEDTMSIWANKRLKGTEELEHPIFFRAWKKIKLYQKLRLQQRVMGRFSPAGAIFLLKANHGMMETEKQILAGDSKEPFRIEIVDEGREND